MDDPRAAAAAQAAKANPGSATPSNIPPTTHDAASTTATTSPTNPSTSTASSGKTSGSTRSATAGPQAGPAPAAPFARHGHALPFVAPSSYLRPKTTATSRTMSEPKQLTPLDREQLQGLARIREFLRVRTSYDVLPLSFRLITLDNEMTIRSSLPILIANNIVSAPLWDSRENKFAGLLTSTDYINVIQYYCQFPDQLGQIDKFSLRGLRDIERAIGAAPLETVSVHPKQPLYEACRQMLKTRSRRIPLVDIDEETGRDFVVSVITQYRILKFIAVNNEHNTVLLKKSVREIGLGSYRNLVTAQMGDPTLHVIQLMVKHNISCVPIVDGPSGRVLNVFEAVDVIPLVKNGAYEELESSVGDALSKRAEDFQGMYTCTADDRLDTIFDTVRKSRMHRLIVVDDEMRLKGIISLSDILKYVLLHGEGDDDAYKS